MVGNTRIVLARPKFSGNIGSIARIMANTGLADLVIVSPQCDPFDESACKFSARSHPILLGAKITDSLPEALAGCAFTVATSCRPGLYRTQTELTPRSLARDLVSKPRPTAIVFGPEDQGLSNDDLLHCDASLRIPSNDKYPSLNLSHAATVIAYELFVARTEASEQATPSTEQPATADLADSATIERLMDRLRTSLTTIGYLNPEKPDHLLMALRKILGKAALTQKEAQTLIGLAQQIELFATTGRTHYPIDKEKDREDSADR